MAARNSRVWVGPHSAQVASVLLSANRGMPDRWTFVYRLNYTEITRRLGTGVRTSRNARSFQSSELVKFFLINSRFTKGFALLSAAFRKKLKTATDSITKLAKFCTPGTMLLLSKTNRKLGSAATFSGADQASSTRSFSYCTTFFVLLSFMTFHIDDTSIPACDVCSLVPAAGTLRTFQSSWA